jgi:iron complex outermembrane receptor protein
MKNLIILIFAYSINSIIAQSLSISGNVIDINGMPLSGVNVTIEGTSTGLATDSIGHYRISNLRSGNYVLEFSSIGYKKFVSDILTLSNNDIILNVSLIETAIQSEQVIITAGKYEQRISELPVSVSIISSKDILDRNVSSLDFAMRYAPGVTMNLDQISIRGSTGYSRGAGTRVLVALDGIPLYTGDTGEIIWEILPTTEINRIEIIKGASSSLYGSTAIGGVVNVITRSIPDHPFIYIKTFFGAYDKPSHKEWDWSGKYRSFNGITLTHSNRINKLGYTLSATRTENSSYRQNDFYKRYTGFLKVNYDLNVSNSITLFANGLNQNRGNFIYWKDSRHVLQPPDADQGQRVISNRYMIGILYRTIFNPNFFLNIRTSYYNTHWKDESASMDNSRAELLRGEVQSTYKFSNNTFLVSGIETSIGKVNSNIFSNPGSKSLGLYSQIDYKLPLPLTISAGARYDYSKLDTINSFYDFSPKLGLNFKLNENTVFRTSIGKGFRAPTLAETFTRTSVSGVTIKPNPKLKPEHNFTFEFGLKQSLYDRIVIDAAFFQNEYYDFIEPGVDPQDGLVQFTNLMRARIQGAELNLDLNILPNTLHFNVNYVYLWTRDIENKKSLKYRPRNLVYATLDYTLGQLEFATNFRFWSRIEEMDFELVDLDIVPDGDKRVPVYVLDLRASYANSFLDIPVKINLNANNVLNYNYIEIIGNLSPIRNFSLSLEVMF